MAIYINIYYSGTHGNARKFAEEMTASGIVDDICAEKGNIRYEYFFPMDNSETLLLIDVWENQKALDIHHKSPMMSKISELRDKYNLNMKVERFSADNDSITDNDKKYIKNRL
ncbi:MAG: antibiotic biosynthesis monooxygenase [Ruminococcus flavefaciens]|nr:antibiotic biosynthesis monooxygenase [Ruminococcus flavefaciens]